MSELVANYSEVFKSKPSARNISVFLRESIDSTMREARRIEESAKTNRLPCHSLSAEEAYYSKGQNFIVFAAEQQAGQGRENRTWISAKDKGLYLTFVFYPGNSIRVDGLTQVASLSVIKSLEKLGVQAYLKLPNDVIVLDQRTKAAQKISGILVDSKSSNSFVNTIYLGLGLNVKKQDFPDSVCATTLEDILEKKQNLFEVFYLLSNQLLADLELFFEHGFEFFKAQCDERMFDLGSR